MRCLPARGKLGGLFTEGWKPESGGVLRAVLTENRRWVREHAKDVLADMALRNGECSKRMSTLAGMSYAAMVQAAEQARLRHALWQMGEAVAAMFEATQKRSARLAALPKDDGPDWETIGQQWK